MVPYILLFEFQSRLVLKEQAGPVIFLWIPFGKEAPSRNFVWSNGPDPIDFKEWTYCCLIPKTETDMATSGFICHTPIPILMTPVSFYQAEQSPFLEDPDTHFLELIKRCTESFMSETRLATPAPWSRRGSESAR